MLYEAAGIASQYLEKKDTKKWHNCLNVSFNP